MSNPKETPFSLGDTVTAEVESVYGYGVLLRRGDERIMVLAPEISWYSSPDFAKSIRPGDTKSVEITGYNEVQRQYIGSIRRTCVPNPYEKYEGLATKVDFSGEVIACRGPFLRVRLSDGVEGTLALADDSAYAVGAWIRVAIDDVDAKNGQLRFRISDA